MDPKTEARIRDRAYHLWLEHGGQHGKANDYWYQAEQEILSEQALEDATSSAREEGPDRSPELLATTPDGTTSGEAGMGRPQKPGEKLPPLPGAAPKKAAPRKAAARPAAPEKPKAAAKAATAPVTSVAAAKAKSAAKTAVSRTAVSKTAVSKPGVSKSASPKPPGGSKPG
jgi:hypothetical protein